MISWLIYWSYKQHKIKRRHYHHMYYVVSSQANPQSLYSKREIYKRMNKWKMHLVLVFTSMYRRMWLHINIIKSKKMNDLCSHHLVQCCIDHVCTTRYVDADFSLEQPWLSKDCVGPLSPITRALEQHQEGLLGHQRVPLLVRVCDKFTCKRSVEREHEKQVG